jgi:hypothetical protein
MILCQFCGKQESIEGALDTPVCQECLRMIFEQVVSEEKKGEKDNQENKSKDAIELLNHMIHAHAHSTHFRIEGINMVKWTDEKIMESLKWMREKLQ